MFLTTITHQGSIAIIYQKGDLIHDNIDQLDAAWHREQGAKPSVVAFSCADLEQIDSGGLALLIRVHQESRENNIELVILDLSPEVQSLFDIAGLSSLFTISTMKKFAESIRA